MNDAKMLELLHKDPNKGMNVLMDKYAGLIYAIVKHVLADFECDSSEIEDCVAEVFSEFYFDYSAFDPKKSSLKNYLCRIAKNNAIDLLRKKQKQGARVDIDTDDFPIQIPDETNLEELITDLQTSTYITDNNGYGYIPMHQGQISCRRASQWSLSAHHLAAASQDTPPYANACVTHNSSPMELSYEGLRMHHHQQRNRALPSIGSDQRSPFQRQEHSQGGQNGDPHLPDRGRVRD